MMRLKARDLPIERTVFRRSPHALATASVMAKAGALVIEHQVIVAEMWAGHVPMEILGLAI